MARPDKNIPDLIIIPGTCRERFLPLAGDFARPLRDAGIVFSGVSELHTGYEIGRPAKNFHLVVFTVGGQALYRTPDSEGTFSPGDLWIVPQPVPQHYGVEKEWRIFWFHLADTEQWAFLRAQPAHIRRSHAPQPLQSAMEQYVSECVSDEPGSEKAARAYAEIIALLLERELQVEADPVARRVRNALYALWEEVNASLHLPWRVKALAARLHLSPMQFYRQVARYQGLRPMEMVARLRMQRMGEMLRNTDYTLERIAPLVGYKTAFALSRAFKKHMGCCPREYRLRSGLD